MKCPNRLCTGELSDRAKFCHECGTPIVQAGGQYVTNHGEIDGGLYQAGRDIVFTRAVGAPMDNRAPEYDVKWSWRSPFTLATLTWLSVLLGVLSLAVGYKGFEPFVRGLLASDGFETASQISVGWLFAFIGLFILAILVISLRRVAKNETQHLSPFSIFPALTGWGRRIGFARLKGRCHCGGRLRFYAKPIGWAPPDPQTGKQKVIEREMTAECVRDPRHHFWRVETTDSPRSP